MAEVTHSQDEAGYLVDVALGRNFAQQNLYLEEVKSGQQVQLQFNAAPLRVLNSQTRVEARMTSPAALVGLSKILNLSPSNIRLENIRLTPFGGALSIQSPL